MIQQRMFIKEIEKLIEQGSSISRTLGTIQKSGNFGQMTDGGFDHETFIIWNTTCLNLLSRINNGKTVHSDKFILEEDSGRHKPGRRRPYHSKSIELFHKIAILKALKSDLESGLLFDHEMLVTAEAFDDILDQADYLLNGGYKDAAAVLTGAVLESLLRKICMKHSISYKEKETINPLNNHLKDVAYNPLIHKQIIAWAELRNRAAHGDFDSYSSDQVKEMLNWVREFSRQHLS